MPAVSDNHASEETLEMYAMGTLDKSAVEKLEEHLLVCPVCQDKLTETEEFVRAAQRAARKLRSAPPSYWERLGLGFAVQKAVWAAGLAILAFGAIWLSRSVGTSPVAAETPVSILLQAARGMEEVGLNRAPAGKPFVLNWDAEELGKTRYRLEVVQSAGRLVFEEEVDCTVSPCSVKLEEVLPQGRYWVRLYEPGAEGALLREFGLDLE